MCVCIYIYIYMKMVDYTFMIRVFLLMLGVPSTSQKFAHSAPPGKISPPKVNSPPHQFFLTLISLITVYSFF